MNYQTLKWMIESMIQSYKCPMCQSGITETSVDIIWAAGSTINIDIECPACKKHSMIRAEVAQLSISNINLAKDKISQIQDIINQMKNKQWEINNSQKHIIKETINDTEIINLSKDLKNKKISASDLFWWNNQDS